MILDTKYNCHLCERTGKSIWISIDCSKSICEAYSFTDDNCINKTPSSEITIIPGNCIDLRGFVFENPNTGCIVAYEPQVTKFVDSKIVTAILFFVASLFICICMVGGCFAILSDAKENHKQYSNAEEKDEEKKPIIKKKVPCEPNDNA